MSLKEYIKNAVKKIPFAFTKNQQYDQQTKAILKKHLRKTSNCIDVGCHKGEMLDEILKFAPEGQHYCFEPIPHLYDELPKKFGQNCHFYCLGLSDTKGETSFNYVISNPSYSGFERREYDKPDEKDTLIQVKTDLLDNIIPSDITIDFIKIDVEGAELQVLLGAKQLIKRCHPVIVFEHGMGAADVYGTTPQQVYQFLVHECCMKISLMKDWLCDKTPLSEVAFIKQFEKKENYYFIAY
jgi:FkbM family methyltransferase